MIKSEKIPILSIIVPTKNRFDYSKFLVDSFLNIKDEDVEFVIFDTSSDNILERYIKKLNLDKRIKYYYQNVSLSFAQTFNQSLARANGEYLTFIGDDDGVNPEIVKLTKWAKKNNIDSISTPMVVTYGWPDLETKYTPSFHKSKLIIRKFNGKIEKINLEKEILKFAQNGFQVFNRLSRVYYGIVSKKVFEKAISNSGSFFWGGSPDISGSTAASIFAQNHYIIDYPIFIGGSSGKSGAGRAGKNKQFGHIKDEWQTREYASEWPSIIPTFFSEQTVWAHAAYLTIQKNAKQDLLSHFNSTYLFAKSAAYSPIKYYSVIFSDYLKIQKRVRVKNLSKFFYCYFNFVAIKILSIFYRMTRIGILYKYLVYKNKINDIKAGVVYMQKILDKKNLSLDNYLK